VLVEGNLLSQREVLGGQAEPGYQERSDQKVNRLVATSAARHRALRSLPIVTHNCDYREDEDKKAGSRVKH
jgi:hypothetical protein